MKELNCDKTAKDDGESDKKYKMKEKLKGLGFASEVAMLMTMAKQSKIDAVSWFIANIFACWKILVNDLTLEFGTIAHYSTFYVQKKDIWREGGEFFCILHWF